MLGTPFLVLPLDSFFNIKLLGCVLVPTALYCIYGIIYRLHFSLVSSFPGPRLAALTFAYEFYYDIVNNGQYIWKIQRLHEKYGPVVCINPYEIHVSDPESANKWYWSTKMFPIEHSLFSTIDCQTHRMRRSALNQFFSMQRAKQLQPRVQERVDTLINRMLDCQLQLWPPRHRIETPRFDPTFSNTSRAAAHSLTLWKFFHPILTLVMSLPECVLKRLGDGVAGTITLKHAFFEQIEVIRSAKKLSEQEKSTLRLTNKAELLVGAGTETTGWTLSIAVSHLLNNPTILGTFKEELKIVDPECLGQTLLAILQSLPYLSAIVNKSLRLSYGATQQLQRVFSHPLIFEPSNDSKTWTMPAGTAISVSIPDLHHNETIFPDSYAFMLERWIEDPGLARYQMAFSMGSSRCLGMNLALAEIYTCLAAVFAKFGSNAVTGDDDIGVLELIDTTIDNVRLWGDCFLPLQKPGSRGVCIDIYIVMSV
ncbi:cytochrome P450 [Leptodontidium sp. 2 PMI_412]|nr:cytochrome P450 [Leptodontidium sp. 2 PMI_412]